MPNLTEAIELLRSYSKPWGQGGPGHKAMTESIPVVLAEVDRFGKLQSKLQRVRDWLKFAANSDSGIVAEIDYTLTGCAHGEGASCPLCHVTDDGDKEAAECHDCGLDYESPAWADVVVPDDTWRLISPTHDENGLLCFNCMNARLTRLGLRNVPYQITSGPFHFAVRWAEPPEATEGKSRPEASSRQQ